LALEAVSKTQRILEEYSAEAAQEPAQCPNSVDEVNARGGQLTLV